MLSDDFPGSDGCPPNVSMGGKRTLASSKSDVENEPHDDREGDASPRRDARPEPVTKCVMLLPKVASESSSRRREVIQCRRCVRSASGRFQIPHQQTAQFAWPVRLSGRLNDYPPALAADAEWLAVRVMGDWVDAILKVDCFKVPLRCGRQISSGSSAATNKAPCGTVVEA
jgi:hypothetical protein